MLGFKQSPAANSSAFQVLIRVYDHVVLQNLGSQIHRKIQKKNSVMLDLKHSPAAHPSAFQVSINDSKNFTRLLICLGSETLHIW